jgi:hypothetical protein
VAAEADACTAYWALAREAIKQGLITSGEARAIARVGHRKQPYWERHIQDLKTVIEERRRG